MKKAVWQRWLWPWLLAAGVAGCVAPHNATTTKAGAAAPPSFTVQTPIDQIAADQGGKAVLERDVPGVMNNPHYVLYSCMSLAQVASLSGGRLTKAKLDKVNKDLTAVPPCVQ